jgi:hypothetical protein
MNDDTRDTVDDATTAIIALLPLWPRLTAPTRRQLVDALGYMYQFLGPPPLPMAREEPTLPTYLLERLRDLHKRGDG